MAFTEAPSAYYAPLPESAKNTELTKSTLVFDTKKIFEASKELENARNEISDFKNILTASIVDEPPIKTPLSRLNSATNVLKLDKAKTLAIKVIGELRNIQLPKGFLDAILFKNNQKKWGEMLDGFEKSIKNENDPQRLVGILDQFLDINKALVTESNRLTTDKQDGTVAVRGQDAQKNAKNTVNATSQQVETAQRVLKGPVEAIEWEGVVFGESVKILETKLQDALNVMSEKQRILYDQVNCITDQVKIIAKLKFEKIQLDQELKNTELLLQNYSDPKNEEKIEKKLSKNELELKSVDLNKKITLKADEIKLQTEQLQKLEGELPGLESAYQLSKKGFDDANEELKKEKLKIVGEHRNMLSTKLDGQITTNKGKLDTYQSGVVTLNGDLTTIQTTIDGLLQKQSKNAADFTKQDEESLKENQKNRTTKVFDKLSNINNWMDGYTKSIISMQQKYHNETKVNEEVMSPLEKKLGVITKEIGTIDQNVAGFKIRITTLENQLKADKEKAIKEKISMTTPIFIGKVVMQNEEIIGYEKQITYLEGRKNELIPHKEEIDRQIGQVKSTQIVLTTSVKYLNEKAINLLLQLNYKIIDSDLGFTTAQIDKIRLNLGVIGLQITKSDKEIESLQSKVGSETNRSKQNEYLEQIAKISTDQLKLLQGSMNKEIGDLVTKENILSGKRGGYSMQSTSSTKTLQATNKTLESQWSEAAKSTEFGPQIAKPTVEIADSSKFPQNLIVEQQREQNTQSQQPNLQQNNIISRSENLNEEKLILDRAKSLLNSTEKLTNEGGLVQILQRDDKAIQLKTNDKNGKLIELTISIIGVTNATQLSNRLKLECDKHNVTFSRMTGILSVAEEIDKSRKK